MHLKLGLFLPVRIVAAISRAEARSYSEARPLESARLVAIARACLRARLGSGSGDPRKLALFLPVESFRRFAGPRADPSPERASEGRCAVRCLRQTAPFGASPNWVRSLPGSPRRRLDKRFSHSSVRNETGFQKLASFLPVRISRARAEPAVSLFVRLCENVGVPNPRRGLFSLLVERH